MKTGIIDVGGGFRAIYGAGVVDRLLEDDVHIDYAIGVSAGSANLACLLSKQKNRCYRFYTGYAFRREYASTYNFVKDHNFVDLDYVYGTLSNHDGEDPLDYATAHDNPMDFQVVACEAETGEPHYFPKSRLRQDDYDVCKASSAVPVACEPYVVDGVPYFDGGIADPVPVQKALDDGCDKVVVVLTRPKDVLREQRKDKGPAAILRRTYPESAEKLLNRYALYNEEVALAKRYEAEGRVLILAPTDLFGLSTLHKNYEGLNRMYRQGYADAAAVADFLVA
ncbi:patatin-like phospholipase family protein [Bifidobacterium callimiconis]|uniref:Patatin family protein n=1 Tax=Bifidobacterium callimiconis TaxID=2306973 RepID=A0A430FF83_9BIFI|nr:patatin family protein [Bifidobacterium callimiconis]MBT1176101.1 patatin family protein [Bifidobacterium callimiconis]RSX51555.1 patatin family protein [Bifidobacterium callimiconis]